MEPPRPPSPSPEGPGAPCRRRCLGALRAALPPHCWREAAELAALAGPVFLAQLMIFLISVVSSIFCGHLGKVELDVLTLAVSMVNVTGVSVCDTLMSQSYGGKNLNCFPCWAIFINTEHILLLLNQDLEVSRIAQIYVMIFIPALPATFLFQLQTRYLQSQGIILPQVITGIVANIINVGMNALLLYALDLGVVGSAWVNTASQLFLCALLFLHVWWRKIYIHTWGGWTRDCFQEWGSYVQLAVPSMLMVCIEWWTFEIGTFLAGLINVTELGAQAVIYELTTAAYMFARDPTVLIREIVFLVSQVMPVFAPFHLFDALAGTCGGVLRGTGKQKIGAVLNAIGYFIFGFPIGVTLMFAAKLGIIGLWYGLIVCVFFQALFYSIYIWKRNWNRVAEQKKK
ncbi:Multidrug And Toxin Extrusion Protein 1 [Manis pentadactyla]|nr:Multidrug And Toxin Extrusion Protein 1 [Manis pentadactyla]